MGMKHFLLASMMLVLTFPAIAVGNGDGNNGCGVGNGGPNGTKDCAGSSSSGGSTVTSVINVSPSPVPITVTPSPVPVTVNPTPITVTVVPPKSSQPPSTNRGGEGGQGGAGGLGGQGGAATAVGGQGGLGGVATASGGDATGGSANATAGSSTVTLNQAAHKRPAYAPDLAGFASGPCTGAGASLTLGLPGVAGGVGTSTVDGQCTLRENIRLVAIFDMETAYRMLEGLDGVKQARASAEPPTVLSASVPVSGRDATVAEYCRLGVAPEHLCR